MNIIKLASNNYFSPAEMTESKIAAVVLHGTAGPLQGSLDWLRNPKSNVSSNYLISKSGVIYELVDWTAGYRAWANGFIETPDNSLLWLNDAIKNKINPNWITVSIEHEASKVEMENRSSMTDAQFNSSIELTAAILRRCRLSANHQTIVGHNQISGKNKYNCPGVIFPPAYTEQLIIRHRELS